MARLSDKTWKVAKALVLLENGNVKTALALVMKHKLYQTPFLKAHEISDLENVKGVHKVWNEFYGEFKLVQSESKFGNPPELNLRSLKRLSQMYAEK